MDISGRRGGGAIGFGLINYNATQGARFKEDKGHVGHYIASIYLGKVPCLGGTIEGYAYITPFAGRSNRNPETVPRDNWLFTKANRVKIHYIVDVIECGVIKGGQC